MKLSPTQIPIYFGQLKAKRGEPFEWISRQISGQISGQADKMPSRRLVSVVNTGTRGGI